MVRMTVHNSECPWLYWGKKRKSKVNMLALYFSLEFITGEQDHQRRTRGLFGIKVGLMRS